MLARVLAMALCPSVRLSVSVRHKSEFYRNGWTNRAGFWHVSFLPSILHCFRRKFGYLQKWRNFRLELCPKLRYIDHQTCYQFSLRKVDAQSVMNWTVVGQLSWQYLRAPTIDHCSLPQRSSSSVYSMILSHGSVSEARSTSVGYAGLQLDDRWLEYTQRRWLSTLQNAWKTGMVKTINMLQIKTNTHTRLTASCPGQAG